MAMTHHDFCWVFTAICLIPCQRLMKGVSMHRHTRSAFIGLMSGLMAWCLSSGVHAASGPYASNLVVQGPSGLLASGTLVTINAHAQGHGQTPLYQFWMESATGWALVQNYSAHSSLNLGALSAGSYIIAVYALDPNQTAQQQWSQAVYQTVVLNVDSQVTMQTPSTLLAGQTATLTAQADNLIQPVYQWWWQNPTGTWQSSGSYQSTAQFSFTPHQSGVYHLIVYAKDPLAPNNPTGAVWSQDATLEVHPISVAYGYFHLSGVNPGRAWYDLQQHTGAFKTF
jgi:hypothetical protein